MLKMLIADDEPVIIRGLQMLIDWAQLGIEICAACENGEDALREIFAQSPDLALLDISMPGKTGIEILKALHTAQSRTKVIFISGFQDFSYAHDALSYGAVDYLLKPVKKDDLLRAVEKCLPVQPDHSAPAPASDTGSYSDAFSRVAEMEPTSYILTAVQPLELNAGNTMERQLIEFSIFGQLDTLCRQTGQGTAFQKKGQCYLLLVNMTPAQATGWLHDAQALLEQRTRCKVGFVCSPATAEMSAVPTFTAPCRDACRWFYFADRLPDTVLAMDAPPFGEAPADTAALHPLQEAVVAGFVETDREVFNRAVENLLAAVPPITDGRADAAVYHLLVCRRMVQARLEYHRQVQQVRFTTRTYDMLTGQRITLADIFPADSPAWTLISRTVRETISAYYPDETPDAAAVEALCENLAQADFMLYGMSLVIPLPSVYENHPQLMQATLYYPQIRAYMTEEAQRQTDNASLYRFCALTYDDGPNQWITPHVLDALMQTGARATFFLVGSRVSDFAYLARQEHDEGHAIGTHFYEHLYANQEQGGKFRAMYDKVNRVHIAAIGIAPAYARAPGGQWQRMGSYGVGWPLIQWTAEAQDWSGGDQGPDAYRTANTIAASTKDGGIILMHDMKINSAGIIINHNNICIVVCATIYSICTFFRIKIISASSAIKFVIICSTIKIIITGITIKFVFAVSAPDMIIISTAVNNVFAFTSAVLIIICP